MLIFFPGTGVSGRDYSVIFYFRFLAVLMDWHKHHKRYYPPSEIIEFCPLSWLSVFGELSINFRTNRRFTGSDTKKSAFKSQN